jgi:hypothetical protein
MPDETRLVEAAMELRGASPDGWERFVRALREYAAMATADMVKVPVEELVKRQGMALSLHVLAMQMRDAPNIYQKHLERLRNGRPTRADSRTEVWAETSETDSGSG